MWIFHVFAAVSRTKFFLSLDYDILEVDPKAEPGTIKRQYYKLARQYHPDKVGADNKEASDKFKDVAEAYQVLSDPDLRKKYDSDGKEGLSGDKTDINQDSKPDPAILLAFLFGSDKFNDYIGRLATSTSAMLGDSAKLSVKDARTLQYRRVTRLASTLAAKIEPWVKEDYDACKVMWKTEAEDLVAANYGWELVQAIGMVRKMDSSNILRFEKSQCPHFFLLLIRPTKWLPFDFWDPWIPVLVCLPLASGPLERTLPARRESSDNRIKWKCSWEPWMP